nr:cucumber peeling cupredoxin-like [Tanacetum cinerariifolium]
MMTHRFSKAMVLVPLPLMVVLYTTTSVSGVTHIVGDSIWSLPPTKTFYDDWAATRDFHIDDQLYFDFDSDLYNVVEAIGYLYPYCNTEMPPAIYEDSPALVLVEKPIDHGERHMYFVSNKLPHHCAIGLRFKIMVNLTTRSPQDKN